MSAYTYERTPTTPQGLAQVLARMHNMTIAEANELVDEMRAGVLDGDDPEELLHDQGLEPDYVWCLISH
jgi:hypothetical protein